jgi:hypothetical protein
VANSAMFFMFPLDMCMVYEAISNCGALVAHRDTFMHTRIQANDFAIRLNPSEGYRRPYNKGSARTVQSIPHNQVATILNSM